MEIRGIWNVTSSIVSAKDFDKLESIVSRITVDDDAVPRGTDCEDLEAFSKGSSVNRGVD